VFGLNLVVRRQKEDMDSGSGDSISINGYDRLIDPAFDGVVGEFVVVNGINLHYKSQGFGRPVVLLHGNSGSHLDFPKELIERLSVEFRVIVFDRPGHGLSERPEDLILTVEQQAEILQSALRQLGVEKPLLVGHSWGGSLVLAFALKHPQQFSGAVLLAPYAFHSEESQSRLEYFLGATLPTLPIVGNVAIRLLTPLVGEWLIEHGLKEAFHPAPVPPHYLETAKRHWTRATQVRAYAEDEKTIDESLARLSPQFSAIQKPVVIVAGELDALVPPDDHAVRLHDNVAESRLVVLPDVGHQIPHTHPDEVIKAINLAWEMADEGKAETEKRG
jgi:pimeloyl-ACP methyl ester carboxylesterase